MEKRARTPVRRRAIFNDQHRFLNRVLLRAVWN